MIDPVMYAEGEPVDLDGMSDIFDGFTNREVTNFLMMVVLFGFVMGAGLVGLIWWWT